MGSRFHAAWLVDRSLGVIERFMRCSSVLGSVGTDLSLLLTYLFIIQYCSLDLISVCEYALDDGYKR